MKKNGFFKATTATKTIQFEDEDGNKNPDEYLIVTYNKVKRPYSEVKAFFRMIKEGQALVKSQGEIKKKLGVKASQLESADNDEQKASLQAQIDALNKESATINSQVEDSIAPFADYLIPANDSPRRVLLDWDLLDDDDVKVPVTREELEDLPAEIIIFIASQLMNDGEVGEEKPAK